MDTTWHDMSAQDRRRWAYAMTNNIRQAEELLHWVDEVRQSPPPPLTPYLAEGFDRETPTTGKSTLSPSRTSTTLSWPGLLQSQFEETKNDN